MLFFPTDWYFYVSKIKQKLILIFLSYWDWLHGGGRVRDSDKSTNSFNMIVYDNILLVVLNRENSDLTLKNISHRQPL